MSITLKKELDGPVANGLDVEVWAKVVYNFN